MSRQIAAVFLQSRAERITFYEEVLQEVDIFDGSFFLMVCMLQMTIPRVLGSWKVLSWEVRRGTAKSQGASECL